MLKKMKKLACIALAFVMMAAVQMPAQAAKPYISITSGTKVSVLEGKTKQIKAKTVGKTKKITYKTSKSSVATVSAKGVITGKKYGTAKIYVKASGMTTKTITVSVKKPVTSVRVSKDDVILKGIGATSKISASVYPAPQYVMSSKLYYKSANTKVATVSSTGTITAKGVGTTTIKVSSSSTAGTVRTKTIYVAVADKNYLASIPDGISYQPYSAKTKTCSATIDTKKVSKVQIKFIASDNKEYAYDFSDIDKNMKTLVGLPIGFTGQNGSKTIQFQKTGSKTIKFTVKSTGEVYYVTINTTIHKLTFTKNIQNKVYFSVIK